MYCVLLQNNFRHHVQLEQNTYVEILHSFIVQMNEFTTGFRTHMTSYKYPIDVYKHVSDGIAKGDRRNTSNRYVVMIMMASVFLLSEFCALIYY